MTPRESLGCESPHPQLTLSNNGNEYRSNPNLASLCRLLLQMPLCLIQGLGNAPAKTGWTMTPKLTAAEDTAPS